MPDFHSLATSLNSKTHIAISEAVQFRNLAPAKIQRYFRSDCKALAP